MCEERVGRVESTNGVATRGVHRLAATACPRMTTTTAKEKERRERRWGPRVAQRVSGGMALFARCGEHGTHWRTRTQEATSRAAGKTQRAKAGRARHGTALERRGGSQQRLGG
ncbi:hypothetical protein ERJ75_000896200 [Trypanosoma vivax]|nr:hypothetical protein ERJ75_000896200 [Trypanosoma vivax]